MVGTQSDRDTVFELCSDRHRRIALAILAGEQRPLTMDDIAKTIVKHTDETPLREVSGETITNVKTSLYHLHLPKIEAAGLIEFDSDREVVEPTAQFDRVEPHLSALLDDKPELVTPLKLETR